MEDLNVLMTDLAKDKMMELAETEIGRMIAECKTHTALDTITIRNIALNSLHSRLDGFIDGLAFFGTLASTNELTDLITECMQDMFNTYEQYIEYRRNIENV